VELLAHRFCLCLKSSLTARLVSGSGTRPDFRAHSIFPKILLFTGKIPFFLRMPPAKFRQLVISL
jgi:hypothetical protein